MTDRIAQLEIELAQLQTDTTYREIEAGLVRRCLKETLAVAIKILDRAADDFDRTHNDMADGINGG